MDRDLYFTRTAYIFKFRCEGLFRPDCDFLRFPTWSPSTTQKQAAWTELLLEAHQKGVDVASKYLCNLENPSFHGFLRNYLSLLGICCLGRSSWQSQHAALGMKTGQRTMRSEEVPKEVLGVRSQTEGQCCLLFLWLNVSRCVWALGPQCLFCFGRLWNL